MRYLKIKRMQFSQAILRADPEASELQSSSRSSNISIYTTCIWSICRATPHSALKNLLYHSLLPNKNYIISSNVSDSKVIHSSAVVPRISTPSMSDNFQYSRECYYGTCILELNPWSIAQLKLRLEEKLLCPFTSTKVKAARAILTSSAGYISSHSY